MSRASPSFIVVPRLHGFALWIAAAALLLQAMLPTVQQPTGFEGGNIEVLFGDIVAHCTASSAGSETVPPDQHPPAHRPLDCSICHRFHAIGSCVQPVVVAMPVRFPIFLCYLIWPNAPGCVFRFEIATRPRGPPRSV